MPMDVKEDFCKIPRSKLSNFTIIGEGGFGFVHKARHEDWGTVAVKSLKAEHVADRHKKNLQAEAEKLSRLNHQNVVQLIGVVLEAGNYSVVLEYVEHGNLDDFINTYEVPWNLKTKMIYSIVLGMNYLHTQTPPMIHRDLKSQNLLVTARFECKITDFGLSQWKSYSRQHTSVNKSHTQGGTVTHIPPEVWEDCNYKADAKCDVYAMGILLWEILTQKVPFDGLMDAQISLSVCRKQRPDPNLIPSDASRRLVDLMRVCWQHEPNKRPAFAEIKRILDEEVSTEHFQYECKRATLDLMRVISDERAASAEHSGLEEISHAAENIQIEQNHSHTTLPYPVQRHASNDVNKKSAVEQEPHHTRNGESKDQTSVQMVAQNRGFVKLNESPMNTRLSPRRTHPNTVAAPRTLPSQNLQTDAAPSDTQPQQETGFDAKEYLKRTEPSPKPKASHSYMPRPPPGAGYGPFGPGFMEGFSMQQPSMVIHDSGTKGKTVQLFNMTGMNSGMNVQVGNNNTMHITSACNGRSPKPVVNHKKITKSTNPIDERNMKIVATNIGKPWMELGRLLGFSEGELEAIENDYRHHGHIETVYQLLLKWKKKMGKHNCKLVTIAEKLVQMDMAHVAVKLVDN